MLKINIMDWKEADTIRHDQIKFSSKGLLVISQHIMPPGPKKIGPHKHENQELAYIILTGKGLVTVGDEEAEVGPYDVIYIPVGAMHSAQNIGDDVFRYVFCEVTL